MCQLERSRWFDVLILIKKNKNRPIQIFFCSIFTYNLSLTFGRHCMHVESKKSLHFTSSKSFMTIFLTFSIQPPKILFLQIRDTSKIGETERAPYRIEFHWPLIIQGNVSTYPANEPFWTNISFFILLHFFCFRLNT